MLLIDSHTHLYLKEFDHDRASMLSSAAQAGVGQLLLPAIDAETHDAMIAMEQQYAQCKAMMGVHPCSVKADYQRELDIAKDWFNKRDFVAVGEIG